MAAIKAVEVVPVSLPLREPYRIARAVQERAEYVLVRVETDEGLAGIGEAAPFQGESEETQADIVATARQHLAPAILGMEVFDLEAIHDRLDTVLPGHLFAKAGIDLALHDLIGALLGVPVYRLLGGRFRERVPLAGGPIGLLGSPEAAAERAARLVAQGFRTVKLKIGDPDGRDEETVRAVREAIGPAVELRLDANQAFTADRAVPLLRRLERYEPALIEQPVAAWDLDGLARVAAALDVPVMADEPVSTPTDVLRIVERRAADLVKIKVMRSGGLLRARKVCAVAEAAGLPVIVGSGHESGIGVAAELHLAAALRAIPYAGEMVGHLRLVEDLIEPSVAVQGGTAAPPEGPGLGVTLASRARERFG
ncbi:MAG: dipeptide epimerase [Candidatus Rokubacteria bacterium]|nr:dipeptide epimerase [Candidatus Rokubacteria bacterium]